MCRVGFDCVSHGPETEVSGRLTEAGMYRVGQLSQSSA